MLEEVKPFASYPEQVKKLKDKGCIIDDEPFCTDVLEQIRYYRLSAYFLPFKGDNQKYKPETHFETVYRIYEFDRKLRSLILSALEVIEVYFRSLLSYFHAEKYGPLGYWDPSNFNNKHNPEKFKKNIEREIKNNEKVEFVKHHQKKYGGKFPLWVVIELFSFGMLSYFYTDLLTSDKKLLFGVNYRDIDSWLRCCTDLRNICAHSGRLYYRVFPSTPKNLNIPEPAKNRLWGAVLTVKNLFPDPERWNNDFMPAIEALFDEYEGHINLYHIAFPDDWIEQLRK